GSLGNSRSADVLPALSQSIGSEDPLVRASAAAALRFVPDPAADSMLAKAITTDENGDVRRAALMAAGFRSYEPLAPALAAVSKHDPDPRMRTEAVAALSNMAGHDSQSMLLLDWVAQHDADKSIRDQAKKALDSAAPM